MWADNNGMPRVGSEEGVEGRGRARCLRPRGKHVGRGGQRFYGLSQPTRPSESAPELCLRRCLVSSSAARTKARCKERSSSGRAFPSLPPGLGAKGTRAVGGAAGGRGRGAAEPFDYS